jgi:hypothetical protein
VALPARARLTVAALAGALGVGVVLASPVLDTTRLESRAEFAQARFGWPVGFVEARLTATPPELPFEARWNPWEDPADFLVWPFLASLALALGAGLIVLLAANVGRVRQSLDSRSRSRRAAPSD